MDDINQWWSWGLAIIGISGVYLTTKKLFWGFVVGFLVQVLWLTYALQTQQYGFILSALGFAWVNALGLYRWTRTPKTEPKRTITPTDYKVSQETMTVWPKEPGNLDPPDVKARRS